MIYGDRFQLGGNNHALLGISVLGSGANRRSFGVHWRRHCGCGHRKAAVCYFLGALSDFFGRSSWKGTPAVGKLRPKETQSL